MRSDGTNQCYLAGVHDSSCLRGKHSGEPDRTCPQVSTQHPSDLWPCTEASPGSPMAGYRKHPNCLLLKIVLPSVSLQEMLRQELALPALSAA